MPRACSSSACLRTTRRTRRMRKSTSSPGRRQFSVEKAYRLSHSTPADRAASMTSITVASAALCPDVRGRERCCAHRPFPSITHATWRGTEQAPLLTGRVARLRRNRLHGGDLLLRADGEELRLRASSVGRLARRVRATGCSRCTERH